MIHINFLVIVLSLVQADYLSSKYVENLKYNLDTRFYIQLRICNAGGKIMAVPHNSTHYEYKIFEDDECKKYVESKYYEGRYFDDITSILENCYAYEEQGDKELRNTACYITYDHRYCNTYTKDKLNYVDYSNGFFYLSISPINASEVIYPTCAMEDPSYSQLYGRYYRNIWRFPSYTRTNLGGKGMKYEPECDSTLSITISIVVLLTMLLF